jgi:hypothetical protein
MKEEGAHATGRLLVGLVEKRLLSLGRKIDRRVVAEVLTRSIDGVKISEKIGDLVFSNDGGGRGDLVVKVGENWKISLSYHGLEEGGEISVFSREDRGDGHGKGWYSQDLPDGRAAKILVDVHCRLGGHRPDMAYVCRSSHMFGGLLWDRSPDQPAEVTYYPNGNVYWRHRYQNGIAKGRPSLPVFENFWENGQLRIKEFGNDLIGKSRPVQEGPAYCEYYHQGQCAVEIYAERKWSESSGRSTLLPTCKARYFDERGQRTTREVLMKTKDSNGVITEDLRRELEDLGESRREEQTFLHRFTESIRLRDCVEPKPFFISPHPNLSSESITALARGKINPALFPPSAAKCI